VLRKNGRVAQAHADPALGGLATRTCGREEIGPELEGTAATRHGARHEPVTQTVHHVGETLGRADGDQRYVCRLSAYDAVQNLVGIDAKR
jgi:hypothetical protein